LKVLGYGEDALTLWALTERMESILAPFGDTSGLNEVLVLYRPSFGRRGGTTSSQFGEFDFIIATPRAVYLGEAKWDKSSELQERPIRLKGEQLLRHKIFTAYYREWISRPAWTANDFLDRVQARFKREGIDKPTPPPDSRLSGNLISVLTMLASAGNQTEEVLNMLLVVDSSGNLTLSDGDSPSGFRLVCIDASGALESGLIPLSFA